MKSNADLYTFRMSEKTLQTDARLGRALVALQESLHDGAGGVINAEAWAGAAGISAGDAWKLAEELLALGVEVEGSAALGFRLTGNADLPLAEVVDPKIAGTIFVGGVRHFAKIDSTNAAAMRAGAVGLARNAAKNVAQNVARNVAQNAAKNAALDATRGEVWVAEAQTSGKGRAGHTWNSNTTDGIYCSALLRPRLAPADVIILSLAAGLAVIEGVHEVTGLWGDLRWPNDVLMSGKKFCGILTELNAEVTKVRYVVVGIGLNVNNAEFPPELRAIATSLWLETGQRFSRAELVAAFLRALDREQAALHHGVSAARESILRRFEKHSSYCCGCAVVVEEDGGYEGVTRGLDDRGFLKIETSQGLRTVLSGGVRKK